MHANRILVTSALFAVAFGLVLIPAVSADNPGNNNPGENNTNQPGNQPGDGGGGGGNPGNNNPGENNTNLQGEQPSS